MSDNTLFTIIGATVALSLLYLLLSFVRDRLRNNRIDYYEDSPYVNPATNLSHELESVLDLYEQSNIRLPQDVLEDVINMKLYDEMEIYNYIENQRHNWKLENGKKLNKKPNQ